MNDVVCGDLRDGLTMSEPLDKSLRGCVISSSDLLEFSIVNHREIEMTTFHVPSRLCASEEYNASTIK